MRALASLALAAALSRAQAPAPVIDPLEVQVRLDRAEFSPGEIDGHMGRNTRRALAAYARARRVDGDLAAIVRASGNAPEDTPHLHFAIFRMTDEKRWWEGTPIDPYNILRKGR